MTSPKNSEKKFRELFERISYSRSYAEVFGDFLDYALLMMNINKTPEDFTQLESKYKSKEEHNAFAQMLFAWSDASFDFKDALGDLFMDCVSHGRNGQFFTPEDVCSMLAILTIGEKIEDGKSVVDPACGSGRTLLAAAKINRNLKFYGSDNDINCVKMAVLNMIVNSMEGEIAHMDALSMQHYGSYHIKKILDGTHYLPYYYKTGAGNTNFIKRFKATVENKDNTNAELGFDMPIILNKKNQATLFFD